MVLVMAQSLEWQNMDKEVEKTAVFTTARICPHEHTHELYPLHGYTQKEGEGGTTVRQGRGILWESACKGAHSYRHLFTFYGMLYGGQEAGNQTTYDTPHTISSRNCTAGRLQDRNTIGQGIGYKIGIL